MKCPVCQKDMQMVGEDNSFGAENKEYVRRRYNCTEDDAWAIVEFPKDTTANLV